jgi:hypothetical protein
MWEDMGVTVDTYFDDDIAEMDAAADKHCEAEVVDKEVDVATICWCEPCEPCDIIFV